ncbi:hypothetical protein [Flammeovirga sp. SJP92]|uniref:hypothetical protein n=1 Tax=Flammeovirga sp. SJP92 TaxID=1775430 RepID=UPI000788C7E4|nr:hypothetical protein [Flammeovirga sp. SJP92]KXX71586.1 hypothetical protein AVL50_04755 [Flammeovirga sp. SJP92]
MKLFVQITIIYFTLNSLFSCAQLDKIQDTEEVYNFDLTSVVDSAVKDLSKRAPSVEKKVFYDGVENTVASSEINWEEELEVFEDADINKPILKNSYEKSTLNKSDGSTLTRFEASGPRELVRWVEVEKNSDGELLKIAFKMLTDNSLYATEKEGQLVFSEGQKLKSYAIQGIQTIVFLGDKHYTVEGNLVY